MHMNDGIKALNSPPGLSPLHNHLLEGLPKGAKCGVIVGVEDGRLARALKQQLGDGFTLHVVEPQNIFHKYLNDLGPIGVDPWDLNWYEQNANVHNGFDFIIFYQMQHYWSGALYTMQKILQLLKPNGCGWLSFYNSASLHEVSRHLFPFFTGFERLSNPMDLWPRMDLASWMIYLHDLGLGIDSVWGMLHKEAHEYCKKNQAKPESIKWNLKDFKMPIRDIGDAFTLGAPVVSLKFSPRGKEEKKTEFFAIPYNASMLQATLFPFLDELSAELFKFKADVEASAQEYEGEDESLIFLDLFVSELKAFKDVKKVLVVGSGWGADLIGLKKLMPQWDITGVESHPEIVEIGEKLLKKKHIKNVAHNFEEALPFEDESFDLVLSVKYFSTIYEPLASFLAEEMLRVAKQGVAQLEDMRGPEVSIELKTFSIPQVYEKLGKKVSCAPISSEHGDSGYYVLTVAK